MLLLACAKHRIIGLTNPSPKLDVVQANELLFPFRLAASLSTGHIILPRFGSDALSLLHIPLVCGVVRQPGAAVIC